MERYSRPERTRKMSVPSSVLRSVKTEIRFRHLLAVPLWRKHGINMNIRPLKAAAFVDISDMNSHPDPAAQIPPHPPPPSSICNAYSSFSFYDEDTIPH